MTNVFSVVTTWTENFFLEQMIPRLIFSLLKFCDTNVLQNESVYLELFKTLSVIVTLLAPTSGVFLAGAKYICFCSFKANMLVASTCSTVTYLCTCSLISLCMPCWRHAHINCIPLCAGVKPLNTF